MFSFLFHHLAHISHWQQSSLLHPVSLFLVISSVGAALVNVTVDDSLPDPVTGRVITYLPGTAWKAGAECTDCTTHGINNDSMLDRTWHDGTYFPAKLNLPPTGPLNATFTFNGTAIYVFCALALSVSGPTGYSNMTFFIDNELVGHFERVPPGHKDYQYNVSVYSNTSIPAGKHTFMLQNGQFGNAGNKSLTLFDYLVYSYDDGKPATYTSASGSSTTSIPSERSSPDVRNSSSAGAIAGGVVGGVVGILAFGLLFWFLRKRQSQALNSYSGFTYLYDPPTTRSASVNTNSSTSPPSAVIPRTAHQRETDAGPIAVGVEEEQVQTLPPEYGQVFVGASAVTPQRSSLV